MTRPARSVSQPWNSSGKPMAAPTRVFVYEGGTTWCDLGQVSDASRVLCMGSYNGHLYVGLDRAREPGKNASSTTVPNGWTAASRMGSTFNPCFRWAGLCTRPRTAGSTVTTAGRSGPASLITLKDILGGGIHLAAVRQGSQLRLFVNAQLAASTQAPEARDFNLSNDRPLTIGFGSQGHFSGALADLRWYASVLDAKELADVMAQYGH